MFLSFSRSKRNIKSFSISELNGKHSATTMAFHEQTTLSALRNFMWLTGTKNGPLSGLNARPPSFSSLFPSYFCLWPSCSFFCTSLLLLLPLEYLPPLTSVLQRLPHSIEPCRICQCCLSPFLLVVRRLILIVSAFAVQASAVLPLPYRLSRTANNGDLQPMYYQPVEEFRFGLSLCRNLICLSIFFGRFLEFRRLYCLVLWLVHLSGQCGLIHF